VSTTPNVPSDSPAAPVFIGSDGVAAAAIAHRGDYAVLAVADVAATDWVYRTLDGRNITATLVGQVSAAAIAVVRTDVALDPLPMNSDATLSVGQVLDVTGHVGTVTAERSDHTADGKVFEHTATVQVSDAHVGDAVSADGKVVGLVVGSDGERANVIPIQLAMAAADLVIDNAGSGVGGLGWLGITAHAADGQVVVDAVVEGAPAAVLGLQPGDVVSAVDDVAISTTNALVAAVWHRGGAQPIRLTVKRAGQPVELTGVVGVTGSDS
jgi:putative serine protease PepD